MTYAAIPPTMSSMTCPAALEVPLMDELTNFDGWQSLAAGDEDEEEDFDAESSNYFKPLVNTESYALLRFRQQQRRRKQRRSQFLFQQIEQMQQEQQDPRHHHQRGGECISPSADVDHSVALDDDFWSWVSEFVSKDKAEENSSATASAAVADTVSAVPNDWENDFGNANDLEKFLNDP